MKGLGKGLDSLIPQNFDQQLLLDEHERIHKLFIKDIFANTDQPRKRFDNQALEELAESIKRHGVLQPIIVSPLNTKEYRIVAGERRWRAAQISGLETIPAIVRKQAEIQQLEIALIENVQRVDLSPIEQAITIEKLHQQFNISYDEIAKRLGKATTTVHNIVRLLQLPKSALLALEQEKISEGHARSILALKNDDSGQELLLKNIIEKGWSVRQAEQFARVKKTNSAPVANQKTAYENIYTKKLAQRLGTKVTLRPMASGGRLEIHYKDEAQLNEFLSKL
ncbi:MAG: ParB/RepB/Spo0J family partition protein [Patescibacteria group bacterium]